MIFFNARFQAGSVRWLGGIKKVAYIDLRDANFVFEALFGYGMFADKLPPCFTSEGLLDYVKKNLAPFPNGKALHYYVEYRAARNTHIPRQLAIPHPASYWKLCSTIKENWQEINEHIGTPKEKFNFCHVRKIDGKNHIFEMNYDGADKRPKEEITQGYYLGCSLVVSADISNCFPSIYSHSIPWAIQGKNKAKSNLGKNVSPNNPKHWSDVLDKAIRDCKDAETNGILVGPHTSGITAEIILTKIDSNLQKYGFKKVIRHIDDYTYFAKDEEDARKFLKCLEVHLKEYELVLNQKKTKLASLGSFISCEWPQKLSRFNFPHKNEIGFTSIDSYTNYAVEIANETNDYAAVNYAIKVIKGKNLTDRAKRLYVKKMLALALMYPYLLPLLEECIFQFSKSIQTELPEFLKLLFLQALKFNATDALAFSFYFALKYDLEFALPNKWANDIVSADDCVSTLLAWKYSKKHQHPLNAFEEKFNDINHSGVRNRDKFWLFLYEYARENSLPLAASDPDLERLRKADVSFMSL